MESELKRTIIALMIPFLLTSCGWFKSGKDNFAKAYKDILVVREKFKQDSAMAVHEIRKIYKKYGYTEASFRDQYFTMAKEEPRKFYNLLDSIRRMAADELMNYEKAKQQKASKSKSPPKGKDSAQVKNTKHKQDKEKSKRKD